MTQQNMRKSTDCACECFAGKVDDVLGRLCLLRVRRSRGWHIHCLVNTLLCLLTNSIWHLVVSYAGLKKGITIFAAVWLSVFFQQVATGRQREILGTGTWTYTEYSFW